MSVHNIIVVLFGSSLFICGFCYTRFDHRHNSYDGTTKKAPWIVKIYCMGVRSYSYPKYLCDGVRIAKDKVITSASCLKKCGEDSHAYVNFDVNNLNATTKLKDKLSSPSQYDPSYHPKYNPSIPGMYDVGILHLHAKYDEYAKTVRIPKEFDDISYLDSDAEISKWQAMMKRKVNCYSAKILSGKECKQFFSSKGYISNPQSSLCAKPTTTKEIYGSCIDFVGSSLVVYKHDGEPILVGIGSYECMDKKNPIIIYTEIKNIVSWINEKINL